MRILQSACFAALLGHAAGALAGPALELRDGSRIEGEIQSVQNGVYTVVSPSLGTVHVAQSNILRIVYGGDSSNGTGASAKPATRDDPVSRDIQQMQTRIAQDPKAVQSITSLQSDPQIQAILTDPAIAKEIQEGDYMSLLANPKIQALDNNEHVKQLVRQQEP